MDTDQIIQAFTALCGGGTVLGLLVWAILRSLPHIAAWRAASANTALVHAQRRLIEAQTRAAQEAVTRKVFDDFKRSAEARIAELERDLRASNLVIAGLRTQVDELERLLDTVRPRERPALRMLEGGEPRPIASLELVTRGPKDER